MRGRQVVPEPAPAEQRHERHVRDVHRRPVRVAARDRRLAAAAGGLDVADRIAVRVAAGAGRPLVGRHVPVGLAAVQQPVGADHAGVADVEDVRVAVVQPQPEADQGEAQRHQHQRMRRTDVDAARPVAAAQADHPDQQVDQRRVDQRRRDEHVALVEPVQGDAEREQRQQVERAHGEGPTPVHQPAQEQGAERQEHPPAVGQAPVRRGLAAGQLPVHLRPGAYVRQRHRRVADAGRRHLRAVAVVERDRPHAVVAERGRGLDPRVLGDPAAQRAGAPRQRDRLRRTSAGAAPASA